MNVFDPNRLATVHTLIDAILIAEAIVANSGMDLSLEYEEDGEEHEYWSGDYFFVPETLSVSGDGFVAFGTIDGCKVRLQDDTGILELASVDLSVGTHADDIRAWIESKLEPRGISDVRLLTELPDLKVSVTLMATAGEMMLVNLNSAGFETSFVARYWASVAEDIQASGGSIEQESDLESPSAIHGWLRDEADASWTLEDHDLAVALACVVARSDAIRPKSYGGRAKRFESALVEIRSHEA